MTDTELKHASKKGERIIIVHKTFQILVIGMFFIGAMIVSPTPCTLLVFGVLLAVLIAINVGDMREAKSDTNKILEAYKDEK